MKIVSITETGKRNKIVHILTDSEEEIRVDGAFVANHSIQEGMKVEDDLWNTWLGEWRHRKAMDVALTYLGYRSRTRAQMEEYLRGKDYPAAAIEDVVEKLKGYGYLDDRRYAREYLESCRRGRPMGRLRIRSALKERGIGDDAIEEVLAAYDGEEELTQAIACLQKQISLRKGKSPEIRRKQCYAALARRGFNWETIQRAWSVLASETEDGT